MVAPAGRLRPLRVTTAAQAAARDQSAIAAGTPSFALMLQAGTQSAAVVLRDYSHRLAQGVAVFAGSGNNGGDAYVVAAQLARAGVRVRLVVAGEPRTPDAARAAAIADRFAPALLTRDEPTGRERLIIDGLLGTGHRGALREPIASRAAQLQRARDAGATIVALDLPSGLDATTGDCAVGTVSAHVTTTYGTVKRGTLLSRATTGRLLLLDIGLATHDALDDGAWRTASAAQIAALLPTIAWDAHKGRRGHVALVGGVRGMAGAIILASRGALASGVGLVRGFVDAPGVPALQQAVPQVIARPWSDAASDDPTPWGHALAIGPGLGRGDDSRRLLRAALDRHPGVPALLDADALTQLTFEGGDSAARLREWAGERDIVCTPHPGEFARLTGMAIPDDWQARAEALVQFARRAHATVLLKGTPTLIASPAGDITAVPRGSAVLATGGSGDVLTGIIGALLAQGIAATDAALLGATAHGRAAELVVASRHGVRGFTLDDVLMRLPDAWQDMAQPTPWPPGVLGEWPAPTSVA